MSRDELTDAEKWLYDNPNVHSTPTVYRDSCYICRDPDYAQMGMSLCFRCYSCGGHVAADDCICDECGSDQRDNQEV